MLVTIDNDGNFLFDGEICTDDRIDDIRDFVNNSNEAFKLLNDYCYRTYDSEGTTVIYHKAVNLLNKAGYCDDGTANCIDNPETTASPIPVGFDFTNYAEGSQLKTFWYDNEGTAHQY